MELIPRGDMQQHAKTCVNEVIITYNFALR